MEHNIDDLTLELAKSFRGIGLPPKLRYRLRKWLQSLSPMKRPPQQQQRQRRLSQQQVQQQRQAVVNTVKSELIARILDKYESARLAKNEMMASVYSDGSIKMDFGSEIPHEVKEAAIKWAKKRGLRPIEASLKKSQNSNETIIFRPETLVSSEFYTCVNRIKYTVS